MMTIEEYRAAILQALLDAKNEDGTPALSEKEATEALNGFTDDELQDGILWNTPQDVADIILEVKRYQARAYADEIFLCIVKKQDRFLCTIQLLFVNLQPHKRKGNLQIPLQSV